MRGLLGNSILVDEVANHTEREDGGSKSITANLGVTSKELSQDLVVVFFPVELLVNSWL
jgi:hypothetical protein